MGDAGPSDRFVPCGNCGNRIARDLDRCPFCVTERTPEPLASDPAPGPSTPFPARPRWRRSWVAPVAVVLGLGVVWGVALQVFTETPTEELCGDIAGSDVPPELVVLDAVLLEEAAGRDGDRLATGVTSKCPDRLGADFEVDTIVDHPDLELLAGDGALDGEINRATEMVLLAEGMLGLLARERLDGLRVVIDTDTDYLAAEVAILLARDDSSAHADFELGAWIAVGDTVFVNLARDRLDYPNDLPIVAHEVAHVFQDALEGIGGVCPGGGLRYGPLWLQEGSAEWLGWHVFHTSHFWRSRGLTHEHAQRNIDAFRARGETSDISLTDLRTGRPIDEADPGAAYALSFAAADDLASEHGPGAFFDFYERLGDRECWVDAFEAVFGVPPDVFEAEFDARRGG